MNLETNSVPTSSTTMQIIKKILMQPEVAKNYYRFLKGNDGNIMVNEIYQSDLGKKHVLSYSAENISSSENSATEKIVTLKLTSLHNKSNSVCFVPKKF